MNLMLGAGLPERRSRADSSYFLGQEGCGLKVRQMLCIDYLCPELEEALGPNALIKFKALLLFQGNFGTNCLGCTILHCE